MGADLITPNPGMHFGSLGPSESQLKRSAELASIISSTVPSDGSGGVSKQDETHHSDGGGHGEDREVERYPVAQVEFSRVETPFVIGVWILSASIAKIGKWAVIVALTVSRLVKMSACSSAAAFVWKRLLLLLHNHGWNLRLAMCLSSRA